MDGMNRNIKLLIEYDGTNYIGWQRQPEHQGKSIQGVLEGCLEKILGHHINSYAAGRTDSGVHAKGQVVNFFTGSKIPAERFPYALAGMLPNDIVVLEACEVPPDFHARYSAIEKTYRYTLLLPGHRSAFEWRYACYVPYSLKIEKMQEAAGHFLGFHDFSSFCAKGSPVKTFTRTVKECRVYSDQRHIFIDITADGFLYNMVRIIVGTLLKVGRGKWSPEKISAIIAAKNRAAAGPTAVPQGLMLFNVKY